MKRMDLSAVQALAVASQLGFVLAAAVVICLFGGAYLDARFGTTPLFLIVGSILGTAAGIYSAIQMYKFLADRFTRSKAGDAEQ